MTIRIGVLISGSGTNLQAIIDASAAGRLDAQVAVVVSSRPGVAGIERARRAGIAVKVMSPRDYDDPAAADQAIVDELRGRHVDYVVMAGYMRKCTSVLLDAFPDHVINLHPALLPSYVGAHAIQDAFDYGAKVTGVTVHIANACYDAGPIVAQRAVEVRNDDTVDSLEQRIHETEHELYPQTLQLFAEGRVHVMTNKAGFRVTRIDD